jgi:peptidoglycan/xylan/chitin deacetylase (PgdA/CDA1 family)
LTRDDLESEIYASKRILEDNLKTVVDLFAYPFGSYGSFDNEVKAALKAGGYKAAFTTIAGVNTLSADLFALKRTRISWYDDEAEFLKELEGDYDWYGIWQALGRAA